MAIRRIKWLGSSAEPGYAQDTGRHQRNDELSVSSSRAVAGLNKGLLLHVDVERIRLVCVESIQEKDADKVRRHGARVMAAVGAEELRTDEYPSYRDVAPEGRHRLCLTHWRKSKCRRAVDLRRRTIAEGRQLEARSMQELLDMLRTGPRPPKAPPELGRPVSRYIRCRKGLLWKINQLLQHVESMRRTTLQNV